MLRILVSSTHWPLVYLATVRIQQKDVRYIFYHLNRLCTHEISDQYQRGSVTPFFQVEMLLGLKMLIVDETLVTSGVFSGRAGTSKFRKFSTGGLTLFFI